MEGAELSDTEKILSQADIQFKIMEEAIEGFFSFSAKRFVDDFANTHMELPKLHELKEILRQQTVEIFVLWNAGGVRRERTELWIRNS